MNQPIKTFLCALTLLLSFAGQASDVGRQASLKLSGQTLQMVLRGGETEDVTDRNIDAFDELKKILKDNARQLGPLLKARKIQRVVVSRECGKKLVEASGTAYQVNLKDGYEIRSYVSEKSRSEFDKLILESRTTYSVEGDELLVCLPMVSIKHRRQVYRASNDIAYRVQAEKSKWMADKDEKKTQAVLKKWQDSGVVELEKIEDDYTLNQELLPKFAVQDLVKVLSAESPAANESRKPSH